jgi:hypothetical protein
VCGGQDDLAFGGSIRKGPVVLRHNRRSCASPRSVANVPRRRCANTSIGSTPVASPAGAGNHDHRAASRPAPAERDAHDVTGRAVHDDGRAQAWHADQLQVGRVADPELTPLRELP